MKRLIALLLALILSLTAVNALADEMTLWEKFVKQVHDSAYRGTVTFEATGDSTAAIDDSVWLLIRSLASRATLEGDHSLTYRTGVGESTVAFKLDDQALATADVRYDKQLIGWSSSLLAGENVFYTAARTWDVSRLLHLAVQGDETWPPVWMMLLEIERAPEEWKTRLEAKLSPYKTKLGVWLNGFASFSTGDIDGVKYTELSCSIPSRAVKTEIQQLMVDFYGDAELLSLLREVFTAQESAAYLQPGVQSTFIALLDALDIEGDVEVVRRYSSQGKLMLDMMTLPFAENSLLSSLTITLRPDEYGDVWGLTGQTNTGMDFDVTCVVSEDGIYTGTVDLILPPEETKEENYIVTEGATLEEIPERRAVSFDYNFAWEPGEDAYSLAEDKYTRNIQATLLIRPREMEDMPTQSLALSCTLSSGSNPQSITHLDGTLTWHDLDSDATVTATLLSRTAAPFATATLDNVTGMRLDQLADESLKVVLTQWKEYIKENFAAVLNRLQTSIFSFTTVN